jgi:hypothetical protein
MGSRLRHLRTIAKRFVVIYAILWVILAFVLLVVFDLPRILAWPVATGVAGGMAWFALDLAFLPEELEEDARQDMEDRSRRSFLDEVDRQGPGPKPKGEPS